MKRKRRSVASYRAASLKAARTRRKMKEARHKELAKDFIEFATEEQMRKEFIDMLRPETVRLRRPTIDRIPKVEWRWP